MLYLLDANVLIDANRDYYPIERVPEFWEWLAAMGEMGLVKVPQEIFEEVVNPPPARQDPLVDWLRNHQDVLLLNAAVRVELVARITEEGYANDLTDVEIEKVGRDPFLIAHALADFHNRCVVSNESSRPSQQRANRRIPDVCYDFNVSCCNTFTFIRKLDFRTGWRTGLIDST